MRLLLLALMAAGLAASEAGLGTNKIIIGAAGTTTVSAEIPWGNADRYVPVVVRVQSPLDGRFRVTAQLGQHSAVAEVELSAGNTRTLTVLLPGMEDQNPHVRLRWTGPGGTSGEETAMCSARSWRAIAIIDRDETLPLKRFEFVEKSSWSHHSSASGLAERVALDALPQRWQGYPGRMMLLFSAGDDRRLDDERRGAIATWVATGGAVAVAEPGQVPVWRAVGVEPIVLDARNDDRALRERVTADGGESRDPPALHSVPGTERVPATGFALVALLFALVVGPLNLWWVRKRGSRHLLLLTTPVLSLATCAGLLVFNLLIEGVALRRTAVQVTLLDQRRAQAVAWTRATYYGGFAVSSLGLDAEGCARQFANDGNQGYHHYGRSRTNDALAIDWRDGQHLAGWIPARINRQLLFTVPRPERARLTVERAGTGWQVTNGLEVGIRRLSWRDSESKAWEADGIAYGATATLQPSRQAANDDGGLGPAVALDPNAQQTLATVTSTAYGFITELDAPFRPLPGPSATDATPIASFVIGHAIPTGAIP